MTLGRNGFFLTVLENCIHFSKNSLPNLRFCFQLVQQVVESSPAKAVTPKDFNAKSYGSRNVKFSTC